MTSLEHFPIPLLGFAAFSGTGKTTLITPLLPELTKRGLRIGMVKHSHHDIEMDNPKNVFITTNLNIQAQIHDIKSLFNIINI